MRNVPDVALVGDDVYVRYDNGGAGIFGGTSCAAPLWAAFTALINQQVSANGGTSVGFLNPLIYTAGNASVYGSFFHDVTTGNNFNASSPLKYPAASGYDLCTGWGTPSDNAAISGLAKPLDGLQVSFSSLVASGFAGVPFTLSNSTITLTNGSATPISWSANATQSWLTLSASSGTLAVGGSTTVTVALNSGANALPGGAYVDNVTFANLASGLRQTRPVTLKVAVPSPVITPVSANFSTLYAFTTSSVNGFNAQCTLLQADDGNFCGTTASGGSSAPGTIFKITPTGAFTSLASLTTTGRHYPTAGLIKGTDGNFYGTASTDGKPTGYLYGNGTVFKVTLSGQVTPVYPFAYGTDGATPYGGLVLGSDGKFYGTTSTDGPNGGGTVFRLTPPYLPAKIGAALNYQVVASNGATLYAATGLPPGMSIDPATGLISGTPTASGTYTVTVAATNQSGTGSATISLVVWPLPPAITSAPSATASAGFAFSYQITATNHPVR